MPFILRTLSVAPGAALILLAAPAESISASAQTPELTCLSAKETRAIIAEKRVVQPADAMKAARAAAPGEAVRVRLCKADGEVLVYQITTVKRDGHVQRVTIDATSGKVSAVR